jgi:hypothetical protein
MGATWRASETIADYGLLTIVAMEFVSFYESFRAGMQGSGRAGGFEKGPENPDSFHSPRDKGI